MRPTTPYARVNGVRLAYQTVGTGPPVLLIPPAATRATIWRLHQVSALRGAGFRVVAYDLRGTPPSEVPQRPYALTDLVADAADLIEALDLGPCLVVGASLGALIAQELALARPDLVRAAAMLATRARTDVLRAALVRISAEQVARHAVLPEAHRALTGLMQLFAPGTLIDDRFVGNWYEMLRRFPAHVGAAGQYLATLIDDRCPALRRVRRPCLVVGFAEDALVPPALCREVAAAIPTCRYVELAGCGHFGFVERPAAVNRTLLDFFASVPAAQSRPAQDCSRR